MIIKVPTHSQFNYEVLIHKDRHQDAMKWCEEQFDTRWQAVGNRAGIWCVFWAGRDHFDQYRFCFVYEQDYVWFLLRWSS
jgi:hypothetical protein